MIKVCDCSSGEMKGDCLFELEWDDDFGNPCSIKLFDDGRFETNGTFSLKEAARRFWEAVATDNPFRIFNETMKAIPGDSRLVVFSGDFSPSNRDELVRLANEVDKVLRRDGRQVSILCLPSGMEVSSLSSEDLRKAGLRRLTEDEVCIHDV